MYCVARERQFGGSTLIRATKDWGEHSRDTIMPLIEVEAYDAAEARDRFKRYLKRWLRNGREWINNLLPKWPKIKNSIPNDDDCEKRNL